MEVEEKEDLQFDDDEKNVEILRMDNKDAKVSARVIVTPDQDDLNDTERALRLDIKEKGEIELVD